MTRMMAIFIGATVASVGLLGIFAFRLANARLKQRNADRAYARLVAEARGEWALVKACETQCEWVRDGKPNALAGWVVLHAEQNSLGERRVRVIHKPDGWPVNGMHTYAQLADWAARAEVRSVPRPDRVPACP